MNNTLYFGGSFNPVHNGHIGMAHCAAEKLKCDKVVLIPAREPYHKNVDPLDIVCYEHRLTMTKFAVYNDPLFEVSEVERGMTGNSYAIDVLERLGAFKDGFKVNYLIGADTALQIPSWHKYDLLRGRVRFIVVLRPGVTLPANLPFTHEIVTFNTSISSTNIRNRCRGKESIEGLVPDQIYLLIKACRFYKE